MISWPLSQIRPLLGSSNPASKASKVDLPAPEAPMMATLSAAEDLQIDFVHYGQCSLGTANLFRNFFCFENRICNGHLEAFFEALLAG